MVYYFSTLVPYAYDLFHLIVWRHCWSVVLDVGYPFFSALVHPMSRRLDRNSLYVSICSYPVCVMIAISTSRLGIRVSREKNIDNFTCDFCHRGPTHRTVQMDELNHLFGNGSKNRSKSSSRSSQSKNNHRRQRSKTTNDVSFLTLLRQKYPQGVSGEELMNLLSSHVQSRQR